MTEDGNKYFRPGEVTSHSKLPGAVEKVLESHGSPLTTPALSSYIGEASEPEIAKSTARRLLYYAKDHIEEETNVEYFYEQEGGSGENNESGGSESLKWRLKK